MFNMDVVSICRERDNAFALRSWKSSELKTVVSGPQALIIPKNWTADDLQDVWAKEYPQRFRESHPDNKAAYDQALRDVPNICRESARTPMQWSSEINAGFCTGKPWMRLHENFHAINVASQQEDPDSLLNFWRRLLKLRKEHADLFVHGLYEELDSINEKVYMCLKKSRNGRQAFVVMNWTDSEQRPKIEHEGRGFVVCSNVDTTSALLQP
jgi:oligo-1,6-glucosidase